MVRNEDMKSFGLTRERMSTHLENGKLFSEKARIEAANWFSILRRGALSEAERSMLETWRKCPANRAVLQSMYTLWDEIAGIAKPTP